MVFCAAPEEESELERETVAPALATSLWPRDRQVERGIEILVVKAEVMSTSMKLALSLLMKCYGA
jgi:hypothetical protein